MKNHIVRISTFLCMALTLVFLPSCEDDGDNGSGQTELLSFGPTGIHHGEEIVFIGNNLDKVTAIVFAPSVEVQKSSFTSATSETIKLNVPNAAETGKVILKTPDGDIESKTVFSLEVPVVISEVTPEAKPGTNITITGEYVNWIESVVFASNLLVEKENFVSQSQTEMVVTVPFEAKTGFLVFNTGGTEPLAINSEDPLIVTIPTVSTVAPLSAKHTDNVTITGTDLDLITEITFGGDIASSVFVSQSETEIVVSVPVGALSGTLTLHQASPVSITTSDELNVLLPKASDLAPKPAVPGVDEITITGTNLDLVSELTLMGATDPIVIPADQFVSISATEIVLALPETTANGPVVYKSLHGYSSNLGVSVLVPTPGPAPLDYYIYDDGLVNGWAKWDGWGTTTQDFASTEEVFDGTQAIMVTYNDQWGAVQIGAPSTDVFAGYTTLSFRIFAPEAQDFIVQLNNDADSYISVPAGWSEVEIPIADMAGNANVTELRFKNNNANIPVTLYIDYIGLKL